MRVAGQDVHPSAVEQPPRSPRNVLPPPADEARSHDLDERPLLARGIDDGHPVSHVAAALGVGEHRRAPELRQADEDRLHDPGGGVSLELDEEVMTADPALGELGPARLDRGRRPDLGGQTELQRYPRFIEHSLQFVQASRRRAVIGGVTAGEMRCADHVPDPAFDELAGQRNRLLQPARTVVQTGQEMAVGVDHDGSTADADRGTEAAAAIS